MILIGNTFPLSLIRRRAVIEPCSLEDLRARLGREAHRSFWGHENTRSIASGVLGIEIASSRAALTLDADQRPVFDGQSFEEVFVLSPDFAPGFRPQIGQEVPAEAITGWQVLKMEFTPG